MRQGPPGSPCSPTRQKLPGSAERRGGFALCDIALTDRVQHNIKQQAVRTREAFGDQRQRSSPRRPIDDAPMAASRMWQGNSEECGATRNGDDL